MEYLVGALVLAFMTAYVVFIAVGIAKGKRWALETAQAISMLDHNASSFELRSRAMEPVSQADAQVAELPVAVEPERLAA